MEVQRSAYDAYAGRKTFRQNGYDARIKECFDLNCRRYDSRRIAVSLKIGRSTVQKVMRQKNLRAIQLRSFKPQTTDSKHGLPICANLLQDGANTPSGKSEVFALWYYIPSLAERQFLLFGAPCRISSRARLSVGKFRKEWERSLSLTFFFRRAREV